MDSLGQQENARERLTWKSPSATALPLLLRCTYLACLDNPFNHYHTSRNYRGSILPSISYRCKNIRSERP